MTLSRRSVVSLKPCFCSGGSALSWIWPSTMSSSRAMSSYCAATLRGWSEEFKVSSPELHGYTVPPGKKCPNLKLARQNGAKDHQPVLCRTEGSST